MCSPGAWQCIRSRFACREQPQYHTAWDTSEFRSTGVPSSSPSVCRLLSIRGHRGFEIAFTAAPRLVKVHALHTREGRDGATLAHKSPAIPNALTSQSRPERWPASRRAARAHLRQIEITTRRCIRHSIIMIIAPFRPSLTMVSAPRFTSPSLFLSSPRWADITARLLVRELFARDCRPG